MIMLEAGPQRGGHRECVSIIALIVRGRDDFPTRQQLVRSAAPVVHQGEAGGLDGRLCVGEFVKEQNAALRKTVFLPDKRQLVGCHPAGDITFEIGQTAQVGGFHQRNAKVHQSPVVNHFERTGELPSVLGCPEFSRVTDLLNYLPHDRALSDPGRAPEHWRQASRTLRQNHWQDVDYLEAVEARGGIVHTYSSPTNRNPDPDGGAPDGFEFIFASPEHLVNVLVQTGVRAVPLRFSAVRRLKYRTSRSEEHT